MQNVLSRIRKSLPCCLLFLFMIACSVHQDRVAFPFQDTTLDIDTRVEDLVARLTLEEKIGQMMHNAPAIERLGIPAYNWWSEALHGVARAGLATVYPQAIGLAATWDEDLMFQVATSISDEARAKHHDFARNGKRFIYQGLTFFSPNINIFRDPRWGRGQETYGEDPYLSGRMGVQFVRGMQGDDPEYFKTIATVKHFAVHSGPEPERHSFDAKTSRRDLLDMYVPQFEMGIREGKAYSLMCAYNRYNGEACCGSDKLLNQMLREEWEFEGYVVSDCWAVSDIYQFHKLVDTPEEAAALAVKSGTELECGETYQTLTKAVEKGLITEKEIDVAVKKLFKARFRLGLFDPPAKVKYASIPYDVVDSEPHRALALDAARKSIVLLKNDPFSGNPVLPLKGDLKRIAVIGPNADQWLMLLGNYNGVPSDPVTPLEGIRKKFPDAEVLYAQGCELAKGMPMFNVIPATALSHDDEPGLQVEFFHGAGFNSEHVFVERHETLDANWRDKAPRDDMDNDGFSVRWTGDLSPDVTAEYQLGVITTCNTELYLNDSLIAETVYHTFDEYGDPRLVKSSPIRLEAGKKYRIRVEAIESYADAQVQLVWARPQPNLKEEAIRVARDADVVLMFMGLTARMEGEEMDIAIEGFRGGDRTRVDLPQTQQDLIRSIQALGKPVVLVLLNGSALAVNWADKNVPAILEAWYPGQAAGDAIADVLAGDYNPAGRLPVTFYRSEKDLPPFEEYQVSTQTYRYFPGEVLYPFGYGLSYTTFSYSDLELEENQQAGDSVRVSVRLKNTGSLDGDEVVQVYVSHLNAPVRVPIRSLQAFDRIHLKAGEERAVTFVLPPAAFSLIDANDERVVLPGEFEISVGGGQPKARGSNAISRRMRLME